MEEDKKHLGYGEGEVPSRTVFKQWNTEMNHRILDIEAEIGNWLSKGVTPECLILNNRTCDEILEHMIEKKFRDTINWRLPVAIEFGGKPATETSEAIDGIPLIIFRSIDLPYGKIIVK